MTSSRRLRIFVPSAADVLTDTIGHGEGLIAFNLLSELAARGHEVVACARRVDFADPPPFTAIAFGEGGRLESLRAPVRAAAARRTLMGLGGVNNFDVAHWIFPHGRDNLLDALPCELPLVVGPLPLLWWGGRHERHAGDVLRWLANPVHRALHGRGMGRAELMVAIPEAVGDYPPELAARCTVVPYGIHAGRFVVGPLPERPTVLFLGRLEPTKGIAQLLEAFVAVRERVAGALLRIAGDGSLRGWLEEAVVSYGLQAHVEVLGAVRNGDVPTLIQESSLMCVPSTGETFGMAYLEAMAGGRAVVAGDWGGPRHLIRPEGGRLVPFGDVPALTRALTELLANRELLAACGRSNRELALSQFSWGSIAARIEEVYAKAIAAARADRENGLAAGVVSAWKMGAKRVRPHDELSPDSGRH
jgi:glycosyltransferase involved in cell wall biosynthesis